MERSDCTVKQRYYFERVWKRALFSYAKFRKEVQIMNEVQIFNNEEFGQVRTVTIDREPWFVGKDVAEALGFTNSRDAIATHVFDDDKGVEKIDTLGGKQNMTVINESGLYALVFGSRLESAKRFKRWVTSEILPSIRKHGTLGGKQNMTVINESGLYALVFGSRLESAKRFKRWVTSEILPSIRKHGIYATDNVIDNILNNPDFGIQLLTKLKEERVARVEAERRNAILMHVNKTYTVTEIAKELGLKSAIQLNKILAEKKIQYQVNGTWVMYSKYSNLGYEEIKQEVLDSGKVIYHRRITQLGREFILQLFADKVA